MLDHDRLIGWRIPEIRQDYTAKDTMLYALGLGCGSDPLSRQELRYVYEDGLVALPSMATILGYPGFWLREADAGADWQRAIHVGQSFDLFRPLATAASVIGRSRVASVVDKGPGKSALLTTERDILDAASGECIARLTHVALLRGHGGFGGSPGAAEQIDAMPTTEPDVTLAIATLPQAALIYRLSGDSNPLHADPDIAAAAGFPRPILHGLCTLGIAVRALLRDADGDAAGLRRVSARFGAPVLPGETISVRIWRDGPARRFSAETAPGAIVLDHGIAEWGL
jgi:acyl dehydratase